MLTIVVFTGFDNWLPITPIAPRASHHLEGVDLRHRANGRSSGSCATLDDIAAGPGIPVEGPVAGSPATGASRWSKGQRRAPGDRPAAAPVAAARPGCPRQGGGAVRPGTLAPHTRIRAAYRRAFPSTVVAVPAGRARPARRVDGAAGRRRPARAPGRGTDRRGHGRRHRRRPVAASGAPPGAGRLDHQDPYRPSGQRGLPLGQGVQGPGGGRAGFLRAMQAKADALGCTDSTWRDPSGLDAPGHRGSAADLAVLGRALLGQPELAELAASRAVRYRWPDRHVQVLANHNHFVSWGRDPGALGIKTGYTVRARSTIVAAQRRGGRTLVAVVLGSDRMYDDVRALLGYGFKVRPQAGAEVLGRTHAPPEAGTQAAAPEGTLPPAAERLTGRVGSPQLVERLGLRMLAMPLPLAACAGVGCLLLGGLVLVWRRPGRR